MLYYFFCSSGERSIVVYRYGSEIMLNKRCTKNIMPIRLNSGEDLVFGIRPDFELLPINYSVILGKLFNFHVTLDKCLICKIGT